MSTPVSAEIRALFSPPHTPDRQRERLRIIADIVCDHPERLYMGLWHHPCGTAHCIAGWAAHLSGRDTRDADGDYIESQGQVGQDLLGYEARAHFYGTTDEEALAWLQQFRTVPA
jgi:hypothetical protein